MFLRVLRGFLVAASAVVIVGFLVVAARFVSRPQAFDPIEVALLERADRFAGGGPLHTDPGYAAAPSLMPGFPLAVSLLSRVLGSDIREPRALAVLVTLLIALTVLLVVRMETQSWTLGLSSVGFLLLGCLLLVEPPGLTRPETLGCLAVLLGFVALRTTHGIWGALLAALPFAAAYFTSPQAGVFLIAAVFAATLEGRRRLVAFTCALAVLVGGGHVALSQALGPWFNHDMWDGPLQALRPNVVAPLHLVGDQLLGRLGVLTLAAVMSFAMPTAPWRGKGGLWMCMGIAALAAGLVSTQTTDAAPWALLPSVVALSVLGPLSMQRVTAHLSAWPGSNRLGGQGVVLIALALQFLVFLSSAASSRWVPAAPGAPGPDVPAAVAAPAPPAGA